MSLLGTVICLDTVRIDISRGDWTAAKETKNCRWEDQQVKDRLYFVRLFYCPGEPMQEHIGKYFEHVVCVNDETLCGCKIYVCNNFLSQILSRYC